MTKRLLLVAAAGALITATVTAYYRAAGTSDGPRLVTVAATRGPVVDTVEATGTVEAVTTLEVGTQVSGSIKALYADYNSRVRRGQVIAQLEPSLFETQVEQARATVQRLQADVEGARVQVQDTAVKLRRAGELTTKQLIPASEFDSAATAARHAEALLKAAEAQVIQAQASLHQNLVNLGHTSIAAPIDGIVISRNVNVGQTVAASMQAPTLFVLAKDLSAMQVSASVDEADVGRIEPGQKVRFSVDAYVDQIFDGTVKQVRLEPVVEQNVVTYVTVIDVPNPDLKLKPGMTANVTIEIAREDDVLRVPNAALRFEPPAEALDSPEAQVRTGDQTAALSSTARAGEAGSGPRVWVLSDGRLTRVPVQVGLTNGTVTSILGGELDEGAAVVTAAVQQTVAATAPSSGSPLLPQRPGGNRNAGRSAQGAQR